MVSPVAEADHSADAASPSVRSSNRKSKTRKKASTATAAAAASSAPSHDDHHHDLYDLAKTKKPQAERYHRGGIRSRSGSPGGYNNHSVDSSSRVNQHLSRGIIDHTIQEARESVRRRMNSGSNHSSNSASSSLKTKKPRSNPNLRRSRSKPELLDRKNKPFPTSSTPNSNPPSSDTIQDILGLSKEYRRKERSSSTGGSRHRRKSATDEEETAVPPELVQIETPKQSRRRRPKQSSPNISRRKSEERPPSNKEGKELKGGRRKSKSTTVAPTKTSSLLSPVSVSPKRRKSHERLLSTKEDKEHSREKRQSDGTRKTKSLSPTTEDHSSYYRRRDEDSKRKSRTSLKKEALEPPQAWVEAEEATNERHIRSLSPHEVRASSRKYSTDVPKDRPTRSLSPHAVLKASKRYQKIDDSLQSPTIVQRRDLVPPSLFQDNVSPLSNPSDREADVHPLIKSSAASRESEQGHGQHEDREGNDIEGIKYDSQIQDNDCDDVSFHYTVHLLDPSDQAQQDTMPMQPHRLASVATSVTSLDYSYALQQGSNENELHSRASSHTNVDTQPSIVSQYDSFHQVDTDDDGNDEKIPCVPSLLNAEEQHQKWAASTSGEMFPQVGSIDYKPDVIPSKPSRFESIRSLGCDGSVGNDEQNQQVDGAQQGDIVVADMEEEQKKWLDSKVAPQTFAMTSEPDSEQMFSPVQSNPSTALHPPPAKDVSRSPGSSLLPGTPKTPGSGVRKSIASPHGRSTPRKVQRSPQPKKQSPTRTDVQKKKLEKNEEEHEYWRQSETLSSLREDIQVAKKLSNKHLLRSDRLIRNRGQRRVKDIEKDSDPFAHSDHSINSLTNMKKHLRDRKARSLSPHGVRASSKRYSGSRSTRRNKSPHEDHA
eukprot:scaffold20120_cov133-Cylindrotheca_fusiformis.AAC.3